MSKIISTFFFFTCIFFAKSQNIILPLNSSNKEILWTFTCDTLNNKWLPAKVPGNSHSDLMENNIVPNLFFGNNEQEYQWIENQEFTYKTNFTIGDDIYSKKDISLVFNGLDTYSSIYLNDEKIYETNNMFRIWIIPIKDKLKQGLNELKIVIHPAVTTALPLMKKMKYKLPADSDRGKYKTSIFTRKAGYQYGWDFAPRFVSCGIWKSVEILAFDNARIKNVDVKTISLNENIATMKASFLLNCKTAGEYKISLSGFDKKFNKTCYLNEGDNNIEMDFELNSPKLWFPNGMGQPNLYTLKTDLAKDGNQIDSYTHRCGIRIIKLVQETDEIGENFYFMVNGKKIFAKGANMVPTDMFLGKIDSSRISALVKMSKEANFNMIRIWGGGIYPEDYFFDKCDEAGIMVWEDFMFACSFYPLIQGMDKNISAEAADNIIRLRNHPSLAIWCGNNEIDEAWHNWGYQKSYKWSKKDSTEIWRQYEKLFKEILPNEIAKFDFGTDYISTSPKYGWGRKQSMTHGDSHYWGIWWGMQPFSMYKEKTGRFVSEYGFQSLPEWSTIRNFVGTQNKMDSPNLVNHQKHTAGFKTINEYMTREFNVPTQLYKYAYLSQILQARGLSIAFIAHQRQKQCNGSLFWQFNDPWNGISWSAIDYDLQPKALYFEAKKQFAPYYAFAESNDENVSIIMKNDSEDNTNAYLQTKIISVSGETIYDSTFRVNCKKSFDSIKTFKIAELLGNRKYDEVIMYFTVKNDNINCENFYTFCPIGKVKLQKPNIKILKDINNNNSIYLKTDKPALYVHLETTDTIEDDYFILIPGKDKNITLNKTKADELRIISLGDVVGEK